MIASQAFILIIFVIKIGTHIYICNVYYVYVIIISIFLNLARMLRSKDTPEGCSPRMYQSVALSVLRYVTLGSQVCLLCTHSLSKYSSGISLLSSSMYSSVLRKVFFLF